MNSQFTSQARTVISLARKAASDAALSYIGTEHLLVGLVREQHGTAAVVLEDNGVNSERVCTLIDQLITPQSQTDVILRPEFTPRATKALYDAVRIAEEHGERQAGTEHILMALLTQPDCMASRLLNTMEVSPKKLYQAILEAGGEDLSRQKEELKSFGSAGSNAHSAPTLDRYSRDLTAMAREGKLDPVIGRDHEIARLIEILSRRKKNNPCLIGEPGVGKTAVVEGLAERIACGSVPSRIADKRVVVLDLSGMVAGSKYRGEFEERIKNVIKEVSTSGDILLFIDEIHTIIGAGGAEGALDASNILKPALARGEIQLIGATTIGEYRKHIEKDAALERRFQPVMVEEPSEAETIEIARGVRHLYEEFHHVNITDDAIEAAVKMSSRYLNDRYQPDKTIDLMDETASRVELNAFGDFHNDDENTEHSGENVKSGIQTEIHALTVKKEALIRSGNFAEAGRIHREQEKLEKALAAKENKNFKGRKKTSGTVPVVTAEDVAATVASWTGIPVERIAEKESKRLARLESVLHRRVVGQDEAVSAVAKAVRRGRTGLKDPNRPIGSFLFLGPTGVGKTELSKALAEAVFGSEDALIRVDMSEYMEKASVAKFIGSPPGYVGYEEGGQLSEKVRRHPYSVVLFDEIEKAHPDVFNILLQVLDDGHITDSQGRKVSFRETIIIMTSNAGAERIVQPKNLGFGSGETAASDYKVMKQHVMEEIRTMFRPEFLNRIDGILVFHPLTKTDMQKIAGILLASLKRRCRDQLSINLNVTPTAVNTLIREGFDSKYGARPLRRTIQNRVEDPLAEEILAGNISAGDTISVGSRDGKITFRKKES